MSRRHTAPIQRAADAIARAGRDEPATEKARAVLEAALDDPDLAPQISTWRRPCGHSRVLNPRESWRGEPTEYDQGCSPCVRDRMRAYFLGET